MQISTPTQVPSSPHESGSPNESGSPRNENSVAGLYGDSPGVLGRKRGGAAQRKNGPGIFAKLLEGLTVKGKSGGQKAGDDAAEGVETDELNAGLPGLHNIKMAEGEPEAGKSGENSSAAGPDGKKTKKPGMGEDFFFDGSAAETLSASFGPDIAAGQRLFRSGETESAGIPAAEKDGGFFRKKEISAPGKLSPGETVPREAVTGFRDGGEGEGADSLRDVSAGPFPDETSEKPELSGAEKAKNRRTADFPSPAAENPGNGFFQSPETARREFDSFNSRQGENENKRLAEFRRGKGREKLNIEVRDLRTPEAGAGESGSGSDSGLKGTAFDAFRQVHTEIEIPVELNFQAGRGEAGSGKEYLNQRFEDALAAQLRGNLSTDIVRDAALIVRNGGEGSIRLSLHPETLGNVKIRLEMTENKITGHIIVESNEALRAFERELPVLEKAFRDSGFSETTLDMSLAQDERNYGGRRQDGDYSPVMPLVASSRYGAGIDGIEDPFLSERRVSPLTAGRVSVNLLV